MATRAEPASGNDAKAFPGDACKPAEGAGSLSRSPAPVGGS
jgi:hypothetical protein